MTVRKRGNRWHFDFQIKGKRYREAVPEARTKWHAEQAETKARDRVFEGAYGTPQLGTQDFAGFVSETYLPWAKANKLSWRSDESIANQWVETFRGKTLGEISPLIIEKHKRERAQSITKRGTQRTPASVNMELAVLSRIFSLAVDVEQAAGNPCRKVRRLRMDNKRNRYLSADEEAALMAQFTGRRAHLKPVVEIALGTGMRRGELLGLQWPQVDFGRGVIYVTNSRKLETSTKTGKDRTVPMSGQVREVLISQRRADRSKGQFVFRSKITGRGLVEIKRAFTAACRDAGLSEFHFHDLRHTFATRLGDGGCHPFVIAALLGHSNVQMTWLYTHATGNALRAAVECASGKPVTTASQEQEQPPALVAVNS
jgi:integrase